MPVKVSSFGHPIYVPLYQTCPVWLHLVGILDSPWWRHFLQHITWAVCVGNSFAFPSRGFSSDQLSGVKRENSTLITIQRQEPCGEASSGVGNLCRLEALCSSGIVNAVCVIVVKALKQTCYIDVCIHIYLYMYVYFLSAPFLVASEKYFLLKVSVLGGNQEAMTLSALLLKSMMVGFFKKKFF